MWKYGWESWSLGNPLGTGGDPDTEASTEDVEVGRQILLRERMSQSVYVPAILGGLLNVAEAKPDLYSKDYLAETRRAPALRAFLPMAMAVFPVPGWPAMSTARPAIFPSRIISSTTPAARRAASCPTMPWEAYGVEGKSTPGDFPLGCHPISTTSRPGRQKGMLLARTPGKI